jgi:short subunit dehydrogenase-like uncharacterized protein
MKTSLESIPKGGLVRRDGKLVRVPAAFEVREIAFADKPRTAMSVPWGDLATAWRSTGIPDITVFMAAKPSVIRAAKVSRLTGPLIGLPPVQRFLQRRIERRVKGPDAGERARGRAEFWGRVTDGAESREMRMTIPEGYTFTAQAALECVRRVRAQAVRPGAWTPSLAFGAEFAGGLPGVTIRPAARASETK